MKKGSHLTIEHKNKISKSTKGRISPNKGKKYSDELKKKLSIAHTGLFSYGIKNMIAHNKTFEARKAMSKRFKGKKGKDSNAYKHGLSADKEYRNWQKNQWHHRNRNAIGEHTFNEWELLKIQYGFTCPNCKRKEPEIKLSLDHIIPLSKGGSNFIENIQPLCKNCNCKKHTKTIRY